MTGSPPDSSPAVLLLDGHRRCWTINPGVEPCYDSALYPVRSGTLTAAQEQQLSADFGYEQWPQLHDTYAGSSVSTG